MKNIINIIFVILGALIGAGFASGQEINIFFFQSGIYGIYGIILSSILIGIVIYKSLKIISQNNIKTYKDFLEFITKKEEKTNKIKNKHIEYKKNTKFDLKTIINIIINIFILITFFIMIAGFGAYIEQELGINKIIGSTIIAIICMLVFIYNVEWIVNLSNIIVPILIISLTVIGTINFKELDLFNVYKILKENNSHFLLNAILYCSYNSILLIPVLITLKKYLKNKKQLKFASIIITICIVILSLIIYSILFGVDVDINRLEMPAVYAISNIHKILKPLYGLIILSSILTTAVSLGISFLQNIALNKKSYTHFANIMCISSIIISQIGFSNLVNSLYPLFGYLGLMQMLLILITYSK